MELSPRVYHGFIRPAWLTKVFIHQNLTRYFNFDSKIVLDFGSGTGCNCPLFKPFQYVGIDPDLKRIEYAKRKYPEYRFIVLEGSGLPIPNRSVDYILIVAVLHHIPSDLVLHYLLEFKRILKPGGQVIAMEPCFFERCYFSNWFMSFFDKGKYIRNEDGYRRLFNDQDFETQVLKNSRKYFYTMNFFSWRHQNDI
ncbi:MAG: methyltransferase domain-containing protein [Alicyclobacillus macrosporangiidus]|uniref:class I SAM-dependent methyltransferase n=1 Tax=Alicyclobacillus macrosporangiidus TaxID=392015 RepID=UPI0026F22098|nr:class I SAM-dependent methyltransferase [Alicyclobacillus macrosporangiidus]MCL6599893.1 methyltransferase domain-containing protein [Alicyclobacillus macrosporangiidus]